MGQPIYLLAGVDPAFSKVGGEKPSFFFRVGRAPMFQSFNAECKIRRPCRRVREVAMVIVFGITFILGSCIFRRYSTLRKFSWTSRANPCCCRSIESQSPELRTLSWRVEGNVSTMTLYPCRCHYRWEAPSLPFPIAHPGGVRGGGGGGSRGGAGGSETQAFQNQKLLCLISAGQNA